MVFLALYGWYWNGEGHYTSNSEVRASSWSNFTKTKIDGDFSFLFTLLEGKLGSQKPNKDGNESQTHGLSNALLHSSVRKSWNRPHLVSKSDPKSNFRVLCGFHLLSRRHRSNSGFPCDPRMDWTWWIWNSKGSSQLFDLPFQFLIQRSSVLFTVPPCNIIFEIYCTIHKKKKKKKKVLFFWIIWQWR